MKPRFAFILVVLLVVAGGAVFLSTRTIAAPTYKIEKVIDNARFIK